MANIPKYNPESSVELGEFSLEISARRKHVWMEIRRFRTEAAAKRKWRTAHDDKGTTNTYQCNVPKRRGTKCAANMKLYRPGNNSAFIVLKSDYDHTCAPRSGLTKKFTHEIQRLRALGRWSLKNDY